MMVSATSTTDNQIEMHLPTSTKHAGILQLLAGYEATIERGLKTFTEVGNALLAIRDGRLYKEKGYETFEVYCRERWGMSRPRAYQMIGAASIVSTLSTMVDKVPTSERQARELTPLKGDEKAILEVWREVHEEYGDAVTAATIKRAVINRAKRVKRERRAAAQQLDPVPETLPEDITILTGDMRELGTSLTDDSVTMVFTDPPYAKEFLSLWPDLARLAARVLRPGGWLVAYSGQLYLPQVMNTLAEHLTYYWLAGLHHNGAHGRLFRPPVFQAMKPILVYRKLPVDYDNWFCDLVESPAGSKEYHKWGQSVEPVRYLVECFTGPGDLVLDPFLGGGTAALACLQAGRRCIGYEIDAGVADDARRRIGEYYDEEKNG